MATDDKLVELPIFVGTGEESDSQNRNAKAPVSRNIRFTKQGSVTSVPPLVESWDPTSNSNIRLLPTSEEVYAADAREISRLETDGSVTSLADLRRPLDAQDLEVALGRACIAWPQALVCGTEIVVTWLEVVAEHGYLPFIATLNLQGDIISPPEQVIAATTVADNPVMPKYSLVKIDDDNVVISCVTASDSSVVSPTTDWFQVRYTKINRVFVTTSDVYRDSTGGDAAAYITSCYDGTYLYHVTYSAPAADTSPWTAGVTTRWVVSPEGSLISSASLSFSASSFASVACQETTGDVWCVYRGYDQAGVFVSEISGSPTTPVALDANVPWFKSTFSTAGAGTTPTPHTKAVFWQFSRLEDGFIFFDDSGNGNIVCQGQGYVGTNFDSTNLIGMSVWRLGSSITAGSADTFPGLSFIGGAWEDNSDLYIPAVSRGAWTAEFVDTTKDPASFAMQLPTPAEVGWYGHFNDSGLSGSSSQPGTRPVFPPSYSVSCLAVVRSTSATEVSSFWAMDEATDHTGLIVAPNRNGLSSGVPNAPANYRCLMGSVLTIDNVPHVLAARQVEARLVGGNGRGGYSAEDLRLEGWGCAVALTAFAEEKQPTTSSTTQRPVIGSDLISTLSGGDILPTALPVPPVMTLPDITGTGGSDLLRSYKLLWCYVDEDGVRHRGPPSAEFRIQDDDITMGTDEGTFLVQVPASQPGIPSHRYLLEVYANPITDSVVGDTLVLVDSIALGDLQANTSTATSTLQVPYSYADTVEGLPFIYTDGGVLPNEARPTTGPITFNRSRVWSFDKRRLFFSKANGYKTPFSFNSNLYFDSPDGSIFTGVATLDEQTVAFTRTGVYLNRGALPNNLGAGGGTVLHHLTSLSGCVNHRSVLETPLGVFFQGERGIYVLKRGFETEFIGFPVEDSMEYDIDWAFYDPEHQEAVFASRRLLLVYSTLFGQWTVREPEGVNLNHGVWHPSFGTVFSRSNEVFRETREVDNDSILFPLKHSTPWLSLDTLQGYQRCKKVLLQGAWDVGNRYYPPVLDQGEVEITPARTVEENRTMLTCRVYVDHQEEASTEVVVDLRQYSRRPLELRIPVEQQKCRAVRFEVEAEESNLDLTITSVTALVGLKKGTDKRPNTPSY